MTQIKCNSIIAGPDYRGQPGETIEVPAKDAANLIKAGAAIALAPLHDPTDTKPAPAGAASATGGGNAGSGEPITTLEGVSIKDVLGLIEAGKLTKEQALALENAGKKRSSLIVQLQ